MNLKKLNKYKLERIKYNLFDATSGALGSFQFIWESGEESTRIGLNAIELNKRIDIEKTINYIKIYYHK